MKRSWKVLFDLDFVELYESWAKYSNEPIQERFVIELCGCMSGFCKASYFSPRLSYLSVMGPGWFVLLNMSAVYHSLIH